MFLPRLLNTVLGVRFYNSIVSCGFALLIISAIFSSFYISWTQSLVLLIVLIPLLRLNQRIKVAIINESHLSNSRFYACLFAFLTFSSTVQSQFVIRILASIAGIGIFFAEYTKLLLTKSFKVIRNSFDIAVLIAVFFILGLFFLFGQHNVYLNSAILLTASVYFAALSYLNSFNIQEKNIIVNCRYAIIIFGIMIVIYAASEDFIAASYLRRALYFENQKKWNVALANYQKAVAINPHRSVYYSKLADFYMLNIESQKDANDIEKAIINYERSLNLKPFNKNLALTLSNAYLLNHNYYRALTLAKSFSSPQDKIMSLRFDFIIIKSLFGLGNATDALAYYKQSIDVLGFNNCSIFFDEFISLCNFLDSSGSPLYYKNNLVKITKNKVDQLLDAPGQLDQKSLSIILNAYYYLDKSGYEDLVAKVLDFSYERAYEKDYKKALSYLNTASFDKNNTKVLYLTGLIYELNGEYNKAIKYLNRIETISPRSKHLNYHLGFCYANIKNFKEAICYLDKAVQELPANICAADLLINIYKRYSNKSVPREILIKKNKLDSLYPLIFMPDTLSTNIGSLVELPDEKKHKCLAAFRGEPKGYLSFGPYLTLPPGNYKVKFYFKISNIVKNNNPVLGLDVFCFDQEDYALGDYPKKYFYRNDFKNYPSEGIALYFTHSGGKNVQFRTETFGNADVFLQKIELLPTGPDAS